ncbi:hypothetical protein CMO95_00270 [Candidatus Woesearchaeota archaeon]|nr:hypothetical protein [Candidatus Woesearchaeota archaeon]|tara:strand:+ start:382 stop:1014 length:633 start_codon:yes stop_codon:yes gene_type:complete
MDDGIDEFSVRFNDLKDQAQTNLDNSINNLSESSKFYDFLSEQISEYKNSLNAELRQDGVILRIHRKIYSQIREITHDVRDLHKKLDVLSQDLVVMTETLGKATVKNRDKMNSNLDFIELMMPKHREHCDEIKTSIEKLNSDIKKYNKNVGSGEGGVKINDSQKKELNNFFLKNTKKLLDDAKEYHSKVNNHIIKVDENRESLVKLMERK